MTTAKEILIDGLKAMGAVITIWGKKHWREVAARELEEEMKHV